MSEEATAEGGSGEESLEEMVAEERVSTNHGAVAIIANADGESIYETKNREGDREERGKIQPYGGHIDRVNGVEETPLEAIIREISEEIGGEAAEIIAEHLKDKSYYKKVSSDYGNTYIFDVVIQDQAKWEIIKASSSKHDAGPRKMIDLLTLLDMPDDQFAWEYGPTIKKFARETFQVNNGYAIPSYKPAEFYSPVKEYKIAA
ncbi:MAG: NUDIX domain-containing protein [Nanoarchaeota archaeon]|nr:NUDIX domain-containing protein [Nanoarchaeota archaeon]